MRPRPTRRLLHKLYCAVPTDNNRIITENRIKSSPPKDIFFRGIGFPPEKSAHFGNHVVHRLVNGASELANALSYLRFHGIAACGHHSSRESARHNPGADSRHKACSCVHTSAPFVSVSRIVSPKTARSYGRGKTIAAPPKRKGGARFSVWVWKRGFAGRGAYNSAPFARPFSLQGLPQWGVPQFCRVACR